MDNKPTNGSSSGPLRNKNNAVDAFFSSEIASGGVRVLVDET